MRYPKRFVKVDISKKLADATFRIIWFFTVKMIPGANNYMLGCLKWHPGIAKVRLKKNGHAFRPTQASKNSGLGSGGAGVCFVLLMILKDLC